MADQVVQPIELQVPTQKGDLAGLHWQGGASGRVPILCVHGWMDNAASFMTLAPRLAPRFDVYAVDLPGHGASPARRQTYHLADWVADIEAIRRHFNWSKFILVAHSMGGAISTLYASVYREHVGRLVLLESLGPFNDHEDDQLVRLRRFVDVQFQPKKSRELPGLKEAVQRRLQSPIGLSKEAALAITGRSGTVGDQGWKWRHDEALAWPSAFRLAESQVRVFLEAVSCPVLVVTGNEGLATSMNFRYKDRLKYFHDIKLLTFPGDHYVHFDAAREVSAAILEFCADFDAT